MCRTGAVVLVLFVVVLASFPLDTSAYIVPCCEFAVYSTDIQPKPGERVDYTGVVTDQFGGGEPGAQIGYRDAGNYQNNTLSTTSDSQGAWHLSVSMPTVSIQYPMSFTITMNDPAQSWSDSITDSYSHLSTSGDVPALYESEFSGRMNVYLNIQSIGIPAIIFLSGGFDQPILTGTSQLDQNTLNLLTSIANAGYNVIAPIGWFITNVPIFPYVLSALLKHGLSISRVYLLGWSAGGTAAAWTLTHDTFNLLDLGVIMDAELQGASGSTQTDESVFNTLQLSNSVKVPHLLIWGQTAAGTTSIQSAMTWVENAKTGLVRLDPFPYPHEWIGTDVQSEIVDDILGFFQTSSVGTFTQIQAGNSTVLVLTNSQIDLGNTTYNPQNMEFTIQVTGPSGTVGSVNAVIPKSSIMGEPVLELDNRTVTVPYSSDSSNYYVFLTYSQSTHVISIGGNAPVPEFTDAASRLLAILVSMFTLVILLTLHKRRRLEEARRP